MYSDNIFASNAFIGVLKKNLTDPKLLKGSLFLKM